MTLFVGDRPSSRTSPTIPFQGAVCEARLNEWIAILCPKPEPHTIINQVDRHFHECLTWCVKNNVPVVALGNNASKAIGSIAHFKLPHPSGRNRQINNKSFIINKLEECKKYLENAKVSS